MACLILANKVYNCIKDKDWTDVSWFLLLLAPGLPALVSFIEICRNMIYAIKVTVAPKIVLLEALKGFVK